MAIRRGGVSRGPDGDQLGTVLSHPHRRLAVRSLADADAELHLTDVARDVVRMARDAGRGPTGQDDVGSVYVQLYHNHAPRLPEAGVVAFDAEAKLVAATGSTGRVAASLPGAAER